MAAGQAGSHSKLKHRKQPHAKKGTPCKQRGSLVWIFCRKNVLTRRANHWHIFIIPEFGKLPVALRNDASASFAFIRTIDQRSTSVRAAFALWQSCPTYRGAKRAVATVREIRPIPPLRRNSGSASQSDVGPGDLGGFNAPCQAWQPPSGLTLLVVSMHKTHTGEVAEWLKAALC